MEWIETTGKTVEEAVERALGELGIDRAELEYEVVQEPRSGLLGIGSQRAHVRARVRPISREKPERRGRGRGRQRGGRPRDGRRQGGRGGDGGGRSEGRGRQRGGRDRPKESDRGGGGRQAQERESQERQAEPRPSRQNRARSEERQMSDVSLEEQADVAAEFARGLVERFGVDADVKAGNEDERVQLEIEGDDLGLLIGSDGATMEAVRELVRTALQRHTSGQSARVSIDIGGYGARRREALEEFARDVARKAMETGRAQVLEPMSPPDRKVVHDAINEIEGVTTTSEGDEPRRRVVIQPS